ncbi:hypothetical protein A2U01_0052179, partial [Trifolium medium]|nr:hypothetical protein [Trifolium medium]
DLLESCRNWDLQECVAEIGTCKLQWKKGRMLQLDLGPTRLLQSL